MSIKVTDLDRVETWSAGVTLPPGRHLCEITSVEEGTSSGGHDQLILEMTAVAGPEVGGTIRDWIVVVPTTYGKVRQILEAAGIEIEGGDWEIPVGRLNGARVAILVRMEKKEMGQHAGKEFAQVAAYDRPKDSDIQAGSDVPADTAGFSNGSGSARRDDDIPFARPPIRDRSVRRRDLFTGDRWLA